MESQWKLQKLILSRYRELGIVGQLPGFQGNVPVQLTSKVGDKNITRAKGTGFMDSLDPLFAKIADKWTEQATHASQSRVDLTLTLNPTGPR